MHFTAKGKKKSLKKNPEGSQRKREILLIEEQKSVIKDISQKLCKLWNNRAISLK